MDLTATIDIPCPADEVFDYVADPVNNPKWQKGMRKCEWITEYPVGVGSQYRQEARFLGRDIISIFEVTEFVPGRTIAFDTVESTFPISIRRSVEDLGDGNSRVSAVIGGGPGVPGFLAGIMGWIAQRSVARDYDRLREELC